MALGEGGNDAFELFANSTSTVTGGSGVDSLDIEALDAQTVTRATFTDFVEGEDLMFFSYYGSDGRVYDKEDFISRFDMNLDGALSRVDEAGGASGLGEAFSFSSTGLTLTFDHAQITLQGADDLI